MSDEMVILSSLEVIREVRSGIFETYRMSMGSEEFLS